MITADNITSHGNTKHGHSRSVATGKASPTYRSWVSMLARCNNPKASNYHLYGGRGIAVCSRWSEFESFLADMGVRPDGCTLDRYPNKSGHYEPGNCRWATPAQQAQNRRTESEGAAHCGPKEKSQCKHGHAMSGDNVRVRADGKRCCRACASMFDKNRKAKRSAKGHEFTPENTYRPAGGRKCRRCHADRQAARKASLNARPTPSATKGGV